MNQRIRVLAAALLGWMGSLALVTSTTHAAPETAVITGTRANLRASPSANAEVIGTLSKGQAVIVLDHISVRDPQPEDPASWARIRVPASVKVWVFAAFVDPKSGMVTSQELKIRSGAGKNYAALGALNQGDLVVPIRTVDGWMQIEPPNDAVAYVSSSLLQVTGSLAGTRPGAPSTPARQPERSPLGQPVVPGNPAPTREVPRTESLPLNPPGVSLPTTLPNTTASPVVNAPPARVSPAPISETPPQPVAVLTPQPAPATPATDATPVEISTSVQYRQPVLIYDENRPRRVLREGVVGLSISPDAPGWYQLDSFRRGEGLIDYLIVDDPKKTDLSKWRGRRVFIEGDEYRDRRWRTPVLKITSIRAGI